MELGGLIRKERKKKELTQMQLAKISGINQRRISDLEAYNRMPDFEAMCKLLDALELDTTKVWNEIREQELTPTK